VQPTSALDVDEHSALHISYFTGKGKNPPEPNEQEAGGRGRGHTASMYVVE